MEEMSADGLPPHVRRELRSDDQSGHRPCGHRNPVVPNTVLRFTALGRYVPTDLGSPSIAGGWFRLTRRVSTCAVRGASFGTSDVSSNLPRRKRISDIQAVSPASDGTDAFPGGTDGPERSRLWSPLARLSGSHNSDFFESRTRRDRPGSRHTSGWFPSMDRKHGFACGVQETPSQDSPAWMGEHGPPWDRPHSRPHRQPCFRDGCFQPEPKPDERRSFLGSGTGRPDDGGPPSSGTARLPGPFVRSRAWFLGDHVSSPAVVVRTRPRVSRDL